MKKLIEALCFLPEKHFDGELVDIETMYRFRIDLLRSVLLTAAIIGLIVGLLQATDILPSDAIYTPSLFVYAVINYVTYLFLKNDKRYFLIALHLCLGSAFAILSLMSALLTYDEMRLSWFYLLIFAGYTLGGIWYGIVLSSLALITVYTQQLIWGIAISSYGLFTFTASLVAFNAAALFFWRLIKCDTSILQEAISCERETRLSKESILHQIEQAHVLHLQDGYLWDTQHKKLTRDGKDIPLTQKEQKLLNLLIHKKNHCVTFEDIMVHLWEDAYDKEISVSTIKVYITKLRKKLPDGCIKNVYGQGYVMHI